jgi:hypothetical protein
MTLKNDIFVKRNKGLLPLHGHWFDSDSYQQYHYADDDGKNTP